MNYQPKISIVTISYNIVSNIEKTIQSVINQSYPNIEYIVIDGGSTDGTLDIIKKYSDKITYWVSEPDKGIYDAMNKGIDAATGDWINFLNAGDVFYHNNVIEKIIPFFDKRFDIIYGDLVLDTPAGLFYKEPDKLESINYKMVFGHQASFIKTEYHKNNRYDITYKSSGDYAFFYNAYFRNCNFNYIPQKVAIFDAKSGMSKDNFYLAKFENLKIYGKENSLLHRIKLYYKFVIWKFKQLIKDIISDDLKIKIQRDIMIKSGYKEL